MRASPKNIGLLIGFISLLYFGFVTPQSSYALDGNNSAGAVVTVNGLAEVTRSSHKQALKAGDPVFEHDVIDVAAGGSAKLLLKDHSILDIGPGTNFRVDKYLASHGSDREVELAVGHGTLRTAVTQKVEGSGKFRVKTNSATMGVRGTEFVVSAGAKTQVTVIQGQVEVAQISATAGGNTKSTSRGAAGGGSASSSSGGGSSGGGASGSAGAGVGKALVLGSGQQVTSSPGVALPEKPNNLDAVALNKISASAKVVDNTYARAITIVVASSANPAASQSGGGTGARAPASSNTSSSSGESGPTANGPAASGPAAAGAPPASNAPVETTVASAGGSGGSAEGAPSSTSGASGSSGSPANAPLAGAGAAPAPAPVAPPVAAAPPPMPASGFGGTTLGDIGTTVATVIAAPPPVNTTQIGISGTFAPCPPPAPVPVNHGGSSTVTIVVK